MRYIYILFAFLFFSNNINAQNYYTSQHNFSPTLGVKGSIFGVKPVTFAPRNSFNGSFYPGGNTPKHEVRAVWLTTIGGIDWPHTYSRTAYGARVQQKELCDILDKLKEAQINTVLIQTRIRGTMIYPSRYEPWDGCLSGITGQGPGYDALAFVISECHKRGMEVHAWVVTIPVGKWNNKGCRNLRNTFPGLIKNIDGEGYMNPEDSRTGDYLANICGEITNNYDIDGIHLDYIRYPETWKISVTKDAGRNYITSIVKKINNRVRNIKPWVKISCSPIGKFCDLSNYSSNGWNAYNKVCQDAQGWLRTGLMDALFPMMYFRNNQFFPFANDWMENSYGKIVAPGLGIYFLDSKLGNWDLQDITREMCHLRATGAGYTFFRSKFFTDNNQGIYNFTSNEFNLYPALVPAMTWINSNRPDAPKNIKVSENELSWSAGHAHNNSPYLLYNVYASKTYPVNTNDACNLVATRLMTNQLTFSTHNLYYAVTALDRYGNESDARQSFNADNDNDDIINNKDNFAPLLLQCNGKYLSMPEKSSTTDASVVIICDLQERLITSKTYNKKIYVGDMKEGMYELRTLNSRNISHRLGFFQVKRRQL
nr:family 10 glycosylhydrolase [Prevotella sp.]